MLDQSNRIYTAALGGTADVLNTDGCKVINTVRGRVFRHRPNHIKL